MAKRKREIVLRFRVTAEERGMIEEKMTQFGTENMASGFFGLAIYSSRNMAYTESIR